MTNTLLLVRALYTPEVYNAWTSGMKCVTDKHPSIAKFYTIYPLDAEGNEKGLPTEE